MNQLTLTVDPLADAGTLSEPHGRMPTTEGARSVTCRPRGHYLNEQV